MSIMKFCMKLYEILERRCNTLLRIYYSTITVVKVNVFSPRTLRATFSPKELSVMNRNLLILNVVENA